MTWPLEYQKAAVDFERFMIAARDYAGLATTNMAWTMVESVLHVFRRRLTVLQALAFASLLPPLLRALFLEGLQPSEEPVPFIDGLSLTDEVRQLRTAHNFAPSNAIEAVARALREFVNETALERQLQQLPDGSVAFWSVPATQVPLTGSTPSA
jgi:uncharacterized protein (DUF2267 family)